VQVAGQPWIDRTSQGEVGGPSHCLSNT
jgi:hypothetical protein